jgi:hypothetical protein
MRPDAARHITAITGILNLDHFRALIGKIHGAKRPGTILLNRQNPHAC